MTNQLLRLAGAMLAAALFDQASAAPQKDQWGCDDVSGVCLTSFKWCASAGEDASVGCPLPGGNPLYYNGEETTTNALVMWEDTYSLTWKNADPAYPVKVEWTFGGEDEAFTWSRELSSQESKFEFTFAKLAKDMLETYDVRLSEIKEEASTFQSRFVVSQPRISDPKKDTSDQFILFDRTAIPYSHTQTLSTTNELFAKWGLGVAIAIGNGLVVLLVLVFFVGWHVGKKVNRRRAAERGELELGDAGLQHNESAQGSGGSQLNEKSTRMMMEPSDGKQEKDELSARKAGVYHQ